MVENKESFARFLSGRNIDKVEYVDPNKWYDIHHNYNRVDFISTDGEIVEEVVDRDIYDDPYTKVRVANATWVTINSIEGGGVEIDWSPCLDMKTNGVLYTLAKDLFYDLKNVPILEDLKKKYGINYYGWLIKKS